MYPVSTPTPPFTHVPDPPTIQDLHRRLVNAADRKHVCSVRLDATREAEREAVNDYNDASDAYRTLLSEHTAILNARSN